MFCTRYNIVLAKIKMGLRRPGATKDYEEMPGENVPVPSATLHTNIEANSIGSQEFELASVSVVPDGNSLIKFF